MRRKSRHFCAASRQNRRRTNDAARNNLRSLVVVSSHWRCLSCTTKRQNRRDAPIRRPYIRITPSLPHIPFAAALPFASFWQLARNENPEKWRKDRHKRTHKARARPEIQLRYGFNEIIMHFATGEYVIPRISGSLRFGDLIAEKGDDMNGALMLVPSAENGEWTSAHWLGLIDTCRTCRRWTFSRSVSNINNVAVWITLDREMQHSWENDTILI